MPSPESSPSNVDRPVVLRADDPARLELESSGWLIVERSWGATLHASSVDRGLLGELIRRVPAGVALREIGPRDVDTVLALDAATASDYPGGVATRHAPLTERTAAPSVSHRGWGAFSDADGLIGMTFTTDDATRVETDFTVVARSHRGLGIGAALKATSVLALVSDGHEAFRTGGSAANVASIAMNRAVGYVLDEEWVTLRKQA